MKVKVVLRNGFVHEFYTGWNAEKTLKSLHSDGKDVTIEGVQGTDRFFCIKHSEIAAVVGTPEDGEDDTDGDN